MYQPDLFSQAAGPPQPLSVSELTAKIKDHLEGTFNDVWVVGEIGDLARPRSGHCYLTLKDEKGAEFIEIGKFEICTQKPPLKGKRVALAYSLETIQATTCYGDPKCKKTETVPLVVGVKIVE